MLMVIGQVLQARLLMKAVVAEDACHQLPGLIQIAGLVATEVQGETIDSVVHGVCVLQPIGGRTCSR
jgi:hypothetical protein